MIRPAMSPIASTCEPPAVPGWATQRGPVTSDAEAAFMAGAALHALDTLVNAAPPWAGAWRQRLALKCAAAAVRLAGRAEDEARLRDAWHLRSPGDDPGPAGAILGAWRQLAVQPPAASADRLEKIVDQLGLHWDGAALAYLCTEIEEVAGSLRPAPFAAAAIAAHVVAMRPDSELIAWWLADLVLAQRLRWPIAVPLLIAQVHTPAFRSGNGHGRIRPGEQKFERAVCLAVAQASAEACRLAADIARNAARLAAAAPKLRAKGAGEAIRLLLDEDAVPGSLQTPHLSRWGARRLFERLTGLGAVRELSGRATFRIYGL
ncbi:DUF1403 family protein [Mesorhizobium sp.]|uniref:DUF1403 family protein n=1 Tax=Mesorhizobium sp. TaxID=1871066 RepID=UPI00120F8D9D|nr:DUF1403 family protein [Mesorhizobium sp.]TIP10651.1 MAG: DUF1403 family protein [Mesorhizobium sp.]